MSSKSKSEWQDSTLKDATARFGERQDRFKTSSDIEIETVYTPEDITDTSEEKISYPGEYPFTRGIQPNMYRGKLWTCLLYTSPSPRD